MNDNLKPLHCTLFEAESGDCGWLWYGDDWHLGRVAFSDDEKDTALYVDVLLDEKPYWLPVADIPDAPWVPISKPPYEGDEKPCTHAVTIQDRRATCTVSWSMNETDGKKSVQRVVQYLHAMLQEEPS